MAVESLGEVPGTSGTLLGGRVRFAQPAEGYRAPVDGLLLADFAGHASRLAVDLGAGAGMVTLTLLARGAAPAVLAIERDAVLVDFLRRNIESNELNNRVISICDDIESAARARRGSADLVVANPPYWSETRATPAKHPAARQARSAEGQGALPVFLQAARALLGRGGRACFVWPAADIASLLAASDAVGLAAKRARFVHALPERPAARVLMEFKPGRPGGLKVEPALVLFDRPSQPSPEARRIMGG